MMGGKASCDHLHQLILGIVDKKARINRQENRKIHDKDQSRRQQPAGELIPSLFPLICGFPLFLTAHCPLPLLPIDQIPEIPDRQCHYHCPCKDGKPQRRIGKRNAPSGIQLHTGDHTEGKGCPKKPGKDPSSSFSHKRGFQYFFHQQVQCQKGQNRKNTVGKGNCISSRLQHPGQCAHTGKGKKHRKQPSFPFPVLFICNYCLFLLLHAVLFQYFLLAYFSVSQFTISLTTY